MPAGCRVLILEDHRPSLSGLDLTLRIHGFSTCPCATMAEAMAKLDGQEIALLDLMLPDGSGLEVLRRIRDEGRPTRVAIVSAQDVPADELRAQGCDAVFPKPLTSNRLDALIRWLNEP